MTMNTRCSVISCIQLYGKFTTTYATRPTRRDIPTNRLHKMASHWFQDIQEFFEVLLRLINTDESHTTAAGSGLYHATKFHFQRLAEYERTLSTLRSRVTESLNWDMSESDNTATTGNISEIITDLYYILQRTSGLISIALVVTFPVILR